MKYFHIAGAQRAGTTSLFYLLKEHPDVLMSSSKETQYFERFYHNGDQWYLDSYFPHHKVHSGCLLGGCRPQNLMIKYAPFRVKASFPDAKIIIMLRHPYLRAYSSWLEYHSMRPGRWPYGWEQTVHMHMESRIRHRYDNEAEWVTNLDPKGGTYHNQFIQASMYAWQVQNWIEVFGRKNVHIAFLEESNNVDFMKGIYDFLGLKNEGQNLPHMFKGGRDNGQLTWQQHTDRFWNELGLLLPEFLRDARALSNWVGRDVTEIWNLRNY